MVVPSAANNNAQQSSRPLRQNSTNTTPHLDQPKQILSLDAWLDFVLGGELPLRTGGLFGGPGRPRVYYLSQKEELQYYPYSSGRSSSTTTCAPWRAIAFAFRAHRTSLVRACEGLFLRRVQRKVCAHACHDGGRRTRAGTYSG